MKRSLLLISVFILTISCGNSEKSKDGSSSSIFKSEIDSPCEILTEAEVKDALSIPADAETKMTERDRSYLMCKYRWESVTYKGTVDFMDTKKTVSYPADMNITMVKDASKEMYEKSISFYKDAEPQDGIGEMAVWSAKKRQISFLSGGYLFHIYCVTSADAADNKEQVFKIAKLIDSKV